MKYNPKIHHRRSIRLKGYDYTQAGAYFITLCCQDRKHRFGKIVNSLIPHPTSDNTMPSPEWQVQGMVATMELNEFGIIAYNEWAKLAERFPNFDLDVFQIMPNHMHGIIVLNDQNDAEKKAGIADIIGAYKSLVANACLAICKARNEILGKLWQRNYHEHIIRDERAYQNISTYIINNPSKWTEDKFYEQ